MSQHRAAINLRGPHGSSNETLKAHRVPQRPSGTRFNHVHFTLVSGTPVSQTAEVFPDQRNPFRRIWLCSGVSSRWDVLRTYPGNHILGTPQLTSFMKRSSGFSPRSLRMIERRGWSISCYIPPSLRKKTPRYLKSPNPDCSSFLSVNYDLRSKETESL